MSDLNPISFEDLIKAASATTTAGHDVVQDDETSSPLQTGERADVPSVALATSDVIPVRYFTETGLGEVAQLLRKIRSDGTLHREEVEDLRDDPQYARPLAGSHSIDLNRVFPSKLDLCAYFTTVFDNGFLEANRKNAGLWTWLALAYYPQFVKTKDSIVQKAADACWIYVPQIYRFGRRHYIAGPLYLYRDVKNAGTEAMEMLFSRPVTEFGRFIDALTNVEESIRTPAFFALAIRLYYDPQTKKHYKPAAINQDGPGSVRQLIRVLQQFSETYDFCEVEDGDTLCNLLPKQFSGFL